MAMAETLRLFSTVAKEGRRQVLHNPTDMLVQDE